MPQLVPITISDGLADYTFNPRGIDANGVSSLVVSTGVPLGDKRLTVSRTRTSTGREKVLFKFTIPVVQNSTIDGIVRPAIVRTAYADVSFSFDGLSTAADRAHARSLMHFLLSSAMASDVVDDLETLY